MSLRSTFAIFFLFAAFGTAGAAPRSQNLDYSYAGTALRGYLAWDDAFSGKRPGILVLPEFWGLNDYARSRADQLAKLGYVALAADLYGSGKSTEHPEEAKAMAGALRANLPEWLGRTQAALQALREVAQVDATKLAATGYCLGGSTALQLALSGADIKLAASFHGGLFVPEKAQAIKGKVLIFHGGSDTFVTPQTLEGLKAKLREAKTDHQIFVYPGAVHGFTVPGAEKRGMPNVAYNAEADQKSWQELVAALGKVFGTSP